MRPPDSWRGARVTLAIAAVTAAAWLIAWAGGWTDLVATWGGFIPARWSGATAVVPLAPAVLTPLTATLIHAGFAHLALNLAVLLVCGRAIEPVIGRVSLVLLYLVGAYAAAAAQWAWSPHEIVPMVGASGAISAVIGAYSMLFGRNRVRVKHARLATLLNAIWLAAAWVGLQVLVGYAFRVDGAQIAVAAHIGGFLAGLVLARPLLLWRWRGA